jgi:hypothetical protein
MDNHLNFFMPFERAPAWHENQLTRAFLVVLRYSPVAHQAWLRLVAPDRQLQDLAPPEFVTQRQRVLQPQAEVPEGESVPGISVWLAPDAKNVKTNVEPSERQQVLDGIITYGSDLVVVIENKITWCNATEQPHQINLHGSPVTFAKDPVSVSWQQLLRVLSNMVERNLASGAERLLITDFLNLVESNFPNIGPYSTLAECGDQRFRVERRLDALIEEAVGTKEGKTSRWRDITGTQKIFMAGLDFSDDSARVCLQMYPADTLGQARAFYAEPASVEAVLGLRSKGWRIEPNFHWGFMATGYAWSKSPLAVEKYCAYWLKAINETGEVARPDWDAYWAKLETDKIVEPTARNEFDAQFTRSQRQKANPRPGIHCEYSWPLTTAKQLDGRGKLAGEIRARINQMLTALEAPLVSAEPERKGPARR